MSVLVRRGFGLPTSDVIIAATAAASSKTACPLLRLVPVNGRPGLDLNGPSCVAIDRLWVERASYAYLTNWTPRQRLFLDDRAAPRRVFARGEAPAARPSKSAVARSDANCEAAIRVE